MSTYHELKSLAEKHMSKAKTYDQMSQATSSGYLARLYRERSHSHRKIAFGATHNAQGYRNA